MEIINEIYQRMKEYSVGCDYVPLEINIKVKPPYWDSAKATMCIVPKNQIKEAILNGKNI